MMGGAQSGSSSTGAGASVYNPTAQPAADQMYQDTVRMLSGQGFGPAGINYPTAQGFVDKYLTNSPYAPQAMQGAQTVADQSGQFFPFQAGSGYQLQDAAGSTLPYAQKALQQGFSPTYQQIVDYTQQNPYFGTALSGASQAANIGGQGASNLQNPIYAGLSGAKTMLNSAFDPQGALFNRGQSQALDSSNVANAMAGVGGTPYGASVNSNALTNYGLNWQDRQLGRQQSGLGAYESAVTGAGNQLAGAANLGASTAALPSATYLGQLNSILSALKAQQTGGTLGAGSAGTLLGAAGGADTQGAGLQNTALQAYLSGTQQPYNTGVGMTNNELSGLTSATNLGQAQYQLPMEVLNALSAYMRLGQQASGLSGQLGNLGFNQTAQGLGGLIGGANTLFGSNSLLGGSSGILGSGGLGSLFGGGAGAAGAGLDIGSMAGSFAGTDALLPLLALA